MPMPPSGHTTQQTVPPSPQNDDATSYLRRNDVMTSKRRKNDTIAMPRARWDI